MPGEVRVSLSLEAVKRFGDVELRDVIRGHDGDELMVELDDLMVFFILGDSMILQQQNPAAELECGDSIC